MERRSNLNAAPENGGGARRLSPAMASFRLLVLSFVTEYILEHRDSPSYGEIAARLDSNRTRVKHAVRSLVADGKLVRIPGPRGLRLPSLRHEVLRQLRELGCLVDEDVLFAPVTNPTLPPRPLFDYPERGSNGGTDEDGQQAA
jgi:hypothetical protein